MRIKRLQKWLIQKSENAYKKTKKGKISHQINANLATLLGGLSIITPFDKEQERLINQLKIEAAEAKLKIAKIVFAKSVKQQVKNAMEDNFWLIVMLVWELITNVLAFVLIWKITLKSKSYVTMIELQNQIVSEQRIYLESLKGKFEKIEQNVETNKEIASYNTLKLDNILKEIVKK